MASVEQLADGQLPDSTGDLYTATSKTIINTMTFVNTDSSAITMNVYLTPSGGTARRISPKDMSLADGDMAILDDEITLDTGDKIQGDASTADVVDYTIGGLDEL